MPTIEKINFIKNNEEKICQMYIDGYSSRKIQEKLSISQRSILRVLKKCNIASRTLSDSISIYSLDENIFEKIDSHEKAYWIGFLAADGCVTSGNLKLVLSKKDHNHVEEFKKFLKSNHKIHSFEIKMSDSSVVKNKNKLYYSSSLSIRNSKIIKDLEKYSIIPNKTYSLIFGKNIPKKFINSYMAGLIDGDGFINISKRGITIGLITNINCAVEFQKELINNLNIRNNKLSFRQDCPSVALIRFSGKKVFDIGQFLYKDTPIYLERKRDKILNFFKKDRF